MLTLVLAERWTAMRAKGPTKFASSRSTSVRVSALSGHRLTASSWPGAEASDGFGRNVSDVVCPANSAWGDAGAALGSSLGVTVETEPALISTASTRLLENSAALGNRLSG